MTLKADFKVLEFQLINPRNKPETLIQQVTRRKKDQVNDLRTSVLLNVAAASDSSTPSRTKGCFSAALHPPSQQSFPPSALRLQQMTYVLLNLMWSSSGVGSSSRFSYFCQIYRSYDQEVEGVGFVQVTCSTEYTDCWSREIRGFYSGRHDSRQE